VSERKYMTPDRALEMCNELEWERLASSGRHLLVRTPLGEWQIIPLADEPYGRALESCLGRAAMRAVRTQIDWALTTMRKASRFQTWGLVCLALGIVLMSASIVEGFASGSAHARGDGLSPWMLALPLVLAPAAFWFGKNILGSRMTRPMPPQKGPFRH